MKHRFILHLLSHTFVIVDITSLGLTAEIYPSIGKEQSVPTLRFQSWKDAKRYLVSQGASPEMLETTFTWLRKSSVAVLTIV
jgi:hypothetical protein